MAKRIKKTTLDKKILKLWSIKVREKAGNKCEICGKQGTLNAHHYWGKKNRSTRYDLDNGVSLCYTCHVGGKYSAHEGPAWFKDKMLKLRGEDWHDKLMIKWRQIAKYTVKDLQNIYDNLNK